MAGSQDTNVSDRDGIFALGVSVHMHVLLGSDHERHSCQAASAERQDLRRAAHTGWVMAFLLALSSASRRDLIVCAVLLTSLMSACISTAMFPPLSQAPHVLPRVVVRSRLAVRRKRVTCKH